MGSKTREDNIMAVIADGRMEKWGMILFADKGWNITHECKKAKFARLKSKPVWGNKFYTKYAKQLLHWGNEPKCIRCWEAIPPMLILMLNLGDSVSINNCRKDMSCI